MLWQEIYNNLMVLELSLVCLFVCFSFLTCKRSRGPIDILPASLTEFVQQISVPGFSSTIHDWVIK